MPTSRSPNYPRIGLKEAVEAIGKVWTKDGRNRITLDAVLRHLGYTSNNGAAQGTVSSLRKYGLLSDGEGRMWVSDLAVDVLEGQNNPEVYRSAIQKAAFRPTLFQELRRTFPDSIPSADALRFHLIKQGFNSDAASKAATTFRETMELVTAAGGVYNGRSAPGSNAEVVDSVEGQSLAADPILPQYRERPGMALNPTAPVVQAAQPRPQLAPPQAGFRQDVFSLAEGEAVLRWPESLSKESYEDFKAWLELELRKVARSVREE